MWSAPRTSHLVVIQIPRDGRALRKAGDHALSRGRPSVAPPRRVGRRRYRNSGIVKPGQADAGSGTTPMMMRDGYVAITDNADPMNVVVYRKRTGRLKCETPVFARGASATENSLITAGRSLFVEN